MASTVGEPTAVPRVMMGVVGSSKVEVGVVDATPEFGAEKPVVPEEQTVLLEALEGMVIHVVRPPSSLVVPPAVEEDEVEEIECEES